jgi:hypothetical protein
MGSNGRGNLLNGRRDQEVKEGTGQRQWITNGDGYAQIAMVELLVAGFLNPRKFGMDIEHIHGIERAVK